MINSDISKPSLTVKMCSREKLRVLLQSGISVKKVGKMAINQVTTNVEFVLLAKLEVIVDVVCRNRCW